ncbi:MAG: M57 family metalloprotease [Nitrososphaeraceae archaeon]
MVTKSLTFTFLFVIIFLIVGIIGVNQADAKKEKIKICCTWGYPLKDGVLNYNFENGDKSLRKMVTQSLDEWEEKIENLEFKKVKKKSDSDIEFKFKKGKGKKVGKTITYFDSRGFIAFTEVSVSKKSYGYQLDKKTLEHIIKHEIGHVLGLGHANFAENLMSANVEKIITEISECEIKGVKKANEWKFVDDKSSPKITNKKSIRC